MGGGRGWVDAAVGGQSFHQPVELGNGMEFLEAFLVQLGRGSWQRTRGLGMEGLHSCFSLAGAGGRTVG